MQKPGRPSETTRISAPWFLQLSDDEAEGEEAGTEESDEE
jgi:hypothetical protein